MSRPRKKWEPEYRFGGNPTNWMKPKPLGENQNAYTVPKTKKRKK